LVYDPRSCLVGEEVPPARRGSEEGSRSGEEEAVE
jgi:hypothetical protein